MWFILIAKSFLCGIALLIPGVGATSAAIVLGLLDRLNYAISSLKRDPLASFSVLIPVAAGLLLGAAVSAKPIALLCEYNRTVANAAFFILSMICVIITYKKYVARFDAKSVAFFVLGTALAFAAENIADKFAVYTSSSAVFLLSGLISSAALILPGISFSYTLLSLGVYDRFLSVFYDPELKFIIPFVCGLAAGTFMFVFLCKKIAFKFGKAFYSLICGLMYYATIGVIIDCFNL